MLPSANEEVQFHRGLRRFEQGDLRGAAEQFDQFELRRRGDATVREIRDLARQQARTEADQRLHADLAVGYEYVSNLVILGRPLGTAGTETRFQGVTLDLDADLTIVGSDQARVAVHTTDFLTGLFLSGEGFSDADDFEKVGSYSGGPEVAFKLTPFDQLSIGYDLQYVTIPPGTHWGATRNAVSGSLTHLQPEVGSTSIQYQFAREDYSPFFGVNRSDSILYSAGGLVHAFSLFQTFDLPRFWSGPQRGGEVGIGLTYERQLTEEDRFRANAGGISAVIRMPVGRSGITCDLGGRFIYTEFDSGDSDGATGRRDHQVAVSAGLTRALAPHLAVRIEGEYLKNGSNAFNGDGDPYEYDSYAVGVRVIYSR